MTLKLVHQDITLRPMIESDIPRLWELTTPETFMHMVNQIQTFEEFDEWMASGYKQMNTTDQMITFVVADTATDELRGSTRIYGIDRVNRTCEIGSTYYGHKFQRTHVNTTAKLLLLTHAFEELGMIRVQIKTDEQNAASQRAIERIGAKKEGILRKERIRSNGIARNAVVYSIIDSEWPEIKKRLEEKMNNYS